MRILLCCGDQGLLTFDGQWHALPCPLISPRLMTTDGSIAVIDTAHSLLWHGGRTLPISRGAEALLLTPGHVLILSGETDCLTLHNLRTGQMLITAPMGMEPQDMCRISPRLLGVCGGADSTVHLVDAVDLRTLGSIRLSGCVQRIAWSGGVLYALCAEHGFELHSQLYAAQMDGRVSRLMELPGLPGALCADSYGGVWVAASETLLHLSGLTHRIDRRIGGTGLIRHMAFRCGQLLTSDPVLGVCRLYAGDGRVLTQHHGDVGQALLMD